MPSRVPASPGLRPAAFAGPMALTAADERPTTLYERGARPDREGRFERAIDRLQSLIAREEHRTDAALYWKAYSLAKLGQRPTR